MKFNKVEISAFRIYNSPENGTFDFTTKNGETANFVSLYAPNGFGKTSFYDAVEWGMTKTIGRLLFKKNKELADSQHVENKLSIIRNNNSDLETFVNITDDNGKVRSQKLNVNARRKFDIEFDNKETQSFHKVVLSQEWISAFLKEDDGELRYEKFIKNPELIKLDAYYKNLIGLINVNNEEITELKKKIDILRDKITETEESDLLNKINDSIVTLESFDEKLQKIKISSTREEIITIRNLIVPRIVELEEELNKNKDLIDSCKIAKNGNVDFISLDLYYSKKKIIESTRNTLLEINSNLKKFKTLEEFINQKNGVVAKREVETKTKEDLAKINDGFKEYQRIDGQISTKTKEKNEKEAILIVKKEKISHYQETEIGYKAQIESSNSEISKINKQLKDIPSFEKDLLKINMDIEGCEKLVKPLEGELKDNEAEKKKNERLIERYERIIEKAREYDHKLIEEQDFVKTELENTYLEKIELIKSNLVTIEGLKKQWSEIVKRVDEQKSLSSNISEFIAKGLDMAKSIKESNCPLCNHPHDSYETLVSKITSNKLLDELLQKLLNEQKVIDDDIIRLKKENDGINIELISTYNNHISNLNDQTNQLNLAELSSKIEELKVKLSDYEKSKLELKDKLGNLTPEELSLSLNNRITELEAEKNKTQSIHTKNKCLLDKRKEQVELLISQIELLKKDVDELKLSEQYILIKDWFKANHPEEKIDRENFDKLISDNTTLMSNYSTEIDKFIKDIGELEKEISSYKKEDLEIEVSQLKKQIENETIKINSYQDFVKELTGSPILETTKESLSKLLLEKENKLSDEKVRVNSLKREYANLEKYMEIVEPYLQSERIKIELSEKKKELKIWEKKVAPTLVEERQQIRCHLEKKIKNFFHTDLINEIYRRIDPHPDFKNVEFKADFGSDNPRLDVFVTDKKLDQALIPNLYFSTAQINILSLSIFLASALNSKEYDCILIDDPIQSMDSINVLSTIDLFRSIIVNQDKQIILSTHDENFNNLLKKKIPKELFKSKFLELESFGKVKSQLN